jgi:hypothetical protein
MLISDFGPKPSPNDSDEVLLMRTKATEREVNWNTLQTLIVSNAYSPAMFHGPRCADNWAGIPSIYVADIDAGLTIEQAKTALAGFQFIIGTTRHHQKWKKNDAPCDRFRIILQLESPITTTEQWHWTTNLLNDVLGGALDSSVNPHMHFLPSLSVVHYSEGAPIPVGTEANWESNHTRLSSPADVPWRQFYIAGKGVLTRDTRNFLAHGTPSGFNNAMFRASRDARDQLYTKEEFMVWANKIPCYLGHLDSKDLAAIKSGFEGRGSGKRQPVRYPGHLDQGSRSTAQGTLPATSSTSPTGTEPQEMRMSPALRQAIVARLEERFLQRVLPEETLCYEITDKTHQEVRLFMNEQILDQFISKNALTYEIDGRRTTRKEAEVKKIWRSFGNNLEADVEPFLFKNQDGWTLKRFTFDIAPGPHPAWDEWLSRLSGPKVFMAWVGGLFDKNDNGRQALWLYGPRGEDGKSTVLRVLFKIFGISAAALNQDQLRNPSRFLCANFFGKRLVTYSDCKSPEFVQHETFRNLTGEDPVPVEFKGMQTMNVVLRLKLAVASNYPPKPTKMEADMSRIILIHVSESKTKADSMWESRLHDEMGSFLYDCFEAHKEMTKGNYKILVGDSLNAALAACATEVSEQWDYILDKYIEVLDEPQPQELSPKNSDIYGLLTSGALMGYKITNIDFGNFKIHLKNVLKLEAKTFREGGKDVLRWPRLKIRKEYAALAGNSPPISM